MAKKPFFNVLNHLSLFLVLILCVTTSHVECSSSVHGGDDRCVGLAGLGVLIGCLDFIRRDRPPAPPSQRCCQGVRGIGMECTCKLVTKEIEEIVKMEKLVYVARGCGKPLASGTVCGSYRVPPA